MNTEQLILFNAYNSAINYLSLSTLERKKMKLRQLSDYSQYKKSNLSPCILTARSQTHLTCLSHAIKRTEFAFMFSHPPAIAARKILQTFRVTVFSFKINIAGCAYVERLL